MQQIPNLKNKFSSTARTQNTQKVQLPQEQSGRGMLGNTWDATHMTSFLNQSFYSNKSPKSKQARVQDQRQITNGRNSFSLRKKNQHEDYFFRNLRHDMNTSHIGFTKVNPLVANVEVSNERKQFLVDFFANPLEKTTKQQSLTKHIKLKCDEPSNFRFESNKVKYRITDPLTVKNQPLPQVTPSHLCRMKRLIQSRHPHGLTGLDHPSSQSPTFYPQPQIKSVHLREHPQSKDSFLLSREWNGKKRVMQPKEEYLFRETVCVRRLRNQNKHGWDIVTNRVVDGAGEQ